MLVLYTHVCVHTVYAMLYAHMHARTHACTQTFKCGSILALVAPLTSPANTSTQLVHCTGPTATSLLLFPSSLGQPADVLTAGNTNEVHISGLT